MAARLKVLNFFTIYIKENYSYIFSMIYLQFYFYLQYYYHPHLDHPRIFGVL